MIHQTKRSPERILGFGIGGAGKSYAALCIALHMPPGKTMWIIETDPAYDRLLEDPEFEDIGTRKEWVWDGEAFVLDEAFLDEAGALVIYHARTWPAIRTAIDEVWAQAKRGDWIVFDNITTPWDKVQEWYWHEVFGKEMDDYLLSIRKLAMQAVDVEDGDKAEGTAGESKFSEWSFINPHYAKHFTDKVLNPPCHIYLTAEQTEYVAHFDKRNKEANIYASLGFKPKGQKKAGHITHTVLHFDHPSHGWTLQTVKDRSREELTRDVWDDFAIDYLVAVGGWVEQDEAPVVTQAQPTPRPRRRT